MVPVAVAYGAAGAGAVSGAGTGIDAEEDRDPCSVALSGKEPPAEACIGKSSYVGSFASKSKALG